MSTSSSPYGEPAAAVKPATSRLDDRERFNQLAAILIAAVTLIATIVAYLQNDAAARDDRANRQAQQAAIQQMGREISGNVEANYQLRDAFRNWSELEAQAAAAGPVEESTIRAAQDAIVRLSPLLARPYFEPANDEEPDITRYEADTYLVEVTGLVERFAERFGVKQAWDTKSGTYILHLTIFAGALFLFGLATTIDSRVRWIFLGAGMFITVIGVAWVIAVFTTPVKNLPEQAIAAYARGVGLAHQARYDEATAAFDEALAAAPGYGNALYERGLAHYEQDHFEAAAADFRAARSAGHDDDTTEWELGYNLYLLGQYEEAAGILDHALETNPELFGARFDRGLTALAAGNTAEAERAYAQAMADATRLVQAAHASGAQPPSALWTYLGYGVEDLIDLIDQLSGAPRAWTDAPPIAAVVRPQAALATAQSLLARLKSLTVALESTGQPTIGAPAAQVSSMTFGQYADTGDETGVTDETATEEDIGNAEASDGTAASAKYVITDVFPPGTDEVLVLFDFAGFKDGQIALVKVRIDDEEVPGWRMQAPWDLGSEGSSEWPLSYAFSNLYVLDPGEYTVELYLENRLLQQGRFTVQDEEK